MPTKLTRMYGVVTKTTTRIFIIAKATYIIQGNSHFMLSTRISFLADVFTVFMFKNIVDRYDIWVTFHTPRAVSHNKYRWPSNWQRHLPHRDPLPGNIELSVTSYFGPTYFIHDSFYTKNTKSTLFSLSASTWHLWLKWTERDYRPPFYYLYFGSYVTESKSEKELIRKVTPSLWGSAWWELMVNHDGVKLKTTQI
jgi:hypothetical protein